MKVRSFFHKNTSTLTYVVYDPQSLDCIVIDPVMDYDQASSKADLTSYGYLHEFIKEHKLAPSYVLETHPHADHLSAAQAFRKDFPQVKIGIGQGILDVWKNFAGWFGMSQDSSSCSDFDLLIADGSILKAGTLEIKAIGTPGHTPACVSYLIDDALFVGDSIFMPDFGTGRCDFPGGSAKTLCQSIRKLYELPDETRVYVGHDYQPGGRELRFKTTIGQLKAENIHINQDTSDEAFIEMRETRDQQLGAPKLLLPSLQVNIQAGKIPQDAEGHTFLRIPVFTT